MPSKSPNLARMHRQLLQHYASYRRDVPWRRFRNPYAIWLSEIMLQQTQSQTVAVRLPAFLATFPTVQALAQATTEQVCEAWAGLGYYRRAVHLHQAAKKVVEEHDAQLPSTLSQLLKLPGIGPYTAGAILSIAYDQKVPLVDGNVERVLSRVFALDMDVRSGIGKRTLWQWAADWVAAGNQPGSFNQALMDLGSLICTPQQPQCPICPLRTSCRAHALAQVEAYPWPKKKLIKAVMSLAYGLVHTPRREIWLYQRPIGGLWSGLWELPMLPEDQAVLRGRPLFTIRHELTHRRIEASIYAVAKPFWPPQQQERYRRYAQPLQAPLSGLMRKALNQWEQLHAS